MRRSIVFTLVFFAVKKMRGEVKSGGIDSKSPAKSKNGEILFSNNFIKVLRLLKAHLLASTILIASSAAAAKLPVKVQCAIDGPVYEGTIFIETSVDALQPVGSCTLNERGSGYHQFFKPSVWIEFNGLRYDSGSESKSVLYFHQPGCQIRDADVTRKRIVLNEKSSGYRVSFGGDFKSVDGNILLPKTLTLADSQNQSDCLMKL